MNATNGVMSPCDELKSAAPGVYAAVGVVCGGSPLYYIYGLHPFYHYC